MPTTPDQLIDQSVRHAVYLERYKGSAVKEYSDLLEKMERAVVGRLNGDITEWSRKRLNKQLLSINVALKKITGDVESLMRSQVLDLGSYEVEFEVKSLGNVMSGYDFDLPSDDQLFAAVSSTPLQATGPYQGQLLDTYMEAWSPRTIQRIDGAIRLGHGNGITTGQLVRDLMASDGALSVARNDVETVVRTGLAHTAQVARNEVWEQNKNVVKGVRITATLDQKTSTICRSLDGQFFKLNKGPRPPFHIRCRTTTTAALDSRFKFLDRDATRSARDPETGKVKKVDADTTYYSWLKRQPASFQNSIIGESRGKLLRNGGISSERFAELQLGKSFEPLTLKEMRKLEPIAFEKAGLN